MTTTSGAASAVELVGREAELALVAAAVRDLARGRASVLAIEGEAGIGKTRLVQSIVGAARSRDMAVFAGQAHCCVPGKGPRRRRVLRGPAPQPVRGPWSPPNREELSASAAEAMAYDGVLPETLVMLVER